MINRLIYIWFILLLSFSLFSSYDFTIITSASEWQIDGDKVFVNNTNVYLSAQPHTIMQDTWVTFKLRSKDYEGDIDACWLFNTTNCKPTKPVYYKVGDGDWQLLTKEFTVQTIDFENMTKAYLLENINIQKDVNYSLKCFVDIKFNTSGKYWWGVKPSNLGWDKGYYIDPWWNSDWRYSKKITIDHTKVNSSLTNFPVLIQNTSTDFKDNARSDGYDFRFVDETNITEYHWELENYDSATGNLTAWVNITSLSGDTDTILYCYYGNSDVDTDPSSTSTWDSNYLFVSHMDNNPDTTHIKDSTVNANHGTKDAATEPEQGTGKIVYGQDFEVGDTEQIVVSSEYSPYTEICLEAWVNFESDTGVEMGIMSNAYDTGSSAGTAWKLTRAADNKIYFQIEDFVSIGTSDTYLAAAGWTYFAGRWDGSDAWVYANAVEKNHDDTAGGVMNNPSSDNLAIGCQQQGVPTYQRWLDGMMDEIRISDSSRSTDWILTTYNTTNSPSTFMTFGSEGEFIPPAQAKINASTGIELTNATLHGYISGLASGEYGYGFWIGTTTPVTEANADRNMTGSGIVTTTGNSDFSHNDSNLSRGVHYYARSWIKNNTYWDRSSNEDDFWTKCDALSSFTATLDGCNVDLVWTKGTGADKTTVVRKVDTYPANQTDGTVVYNDTASTYEDTTAGGSHQYYRVWSWAGDKHSDENASANVIVPPCPPTSVTGEVLVNNTLKISWTKGTGAVTTLVIRKIDSSPSSVTDGTVMYNNTGTHFVATDLTENYHYRLWSYANETYSSSVALDFGALVINCYDEETNDSLYFDVFVSNQSGSQTYESKDNSNPLIINVGDNLPIDDQVSIRVSAASNYSEKSETFTGYDGDENTTVTYIILLQEPESKALTNVTCRNATASTNSYPAFTLDTDVITILAETADEFSQITVNYIHYEYGSRTYYRDLTTNHVFILNVYLPNADDEELYKLIVLNQFDSPVEDAYIQIKRSVGGTYVVISSLYTDASGRIDVYLIPEEQYKVTISKSGYETKTSDFIPPQIIYAEDRTHIFRLNFEIPPEEPEINIWDIITFDAYFLENDNNTLYVTYQDSSGNSTQVQIRIYQNGTDLLYNNTFLNNNSFTIEWTEANHALYDYLVRLDIYNHSDLDNQSSIIMLPKAIPSKQQFTLDLEFDLGAILGDLGEHPIGWVNCIVFFFGVFIIVTFGKYWAGLSLISLGLLLGLFEIIIGLPGFTGSQIAAIAFMVLFGFLVEVAKYKKTVRI